MRKLHTAVADEIHRIAKDDPERAAEMRMSPEYAAEVRGQFDEDVDPADIDDDDYAEADARAEEAAMEEAEDQNDDAADD